MNFLKLCQALNVECGITGANQPASVSNQNDILKHLVEWIRVADYTIQNLFFDWRFLWSSTTQILVTGSMTSVPVSNMKHIDPESVIIIDDTDRISINVIDYKLLRDMRDDTVAGTPFVCAISPDNQIVFPQPTDKEYRIYYEYYKKPLELTDNTDVSLIPPEYHRCIILQAKIYYAERYTIPEVAQEAGKQYKELFDRLKSDQLPGLTNMRTVQPEFMTVVPE